MKKSLSFFSLIAMLLFTSSCAKENIKPLSSNSFLSYTSSLYDITSRLTTPNDISTFLPVENFNPYEDAIADVILKQNRSGFQEFNLNLLSLKTVGVDFPDELKGLIKSCQLIASVRSETNNTKYVLATYNPEADNLANNFTIDISPEDFTSFTKENALTYYSFVVDFHSPPANENPVFVRYRISVDYESHIQPLKK